MNNPHGMSELEMAKRFAIEANELLREMWNANAIPDDFKAQAAKVLGIPVTQKAV